MYGNTISIPYALASVNMTGFKELDSVTFARIQNAIKINKERWEAPSESVEARVILDAEIEARKLAKKNTPKYLEAKRQYDAYCQKHSEIFRREEGLRAGTIYNFYYSAILKLTHREQADRFKAKYADIYQEKDRLWHEVCRYEVYSPQNVARTIEAAKQDAKNAQYYKNRRAQEQWDEAHRIKCKAVERDFAQTRGFCYLIQNLKIEVQGNMYTIRCERAGFAASPRFERFCQTFINKELSISR